MSCVDNIIQKLRESRIDEARVGAFYFIGNKIISNSIDMKDGDSYGNFVNYSSHWDLWKAFLKDYPEYKYFDYDYFPRGRVIFDKNRWKYILYADPKLLKDRRFLEKIESEYELRKGAYEIGDDEHYQSLQTEDDYDEDELDVDVLFNESLDHYIKRDTY